MNLIDYWLVLKIKIMGGDWASVALSVSVVCVLQQSPSQTAQTEQATCRCIYRYIHGYVHVTCYKLSLEN